MEESGREIHHDDWGSSTQFPRDRKDTCRDSKCPCLDTSVKSRRRKPFLKSQPIWDTTIRNKISTWMKEVIRIKKTAAFQGSRRLTKNKAILMNHCFPLILFLNPKIEEELETAGSSWSWKWKTMTSDFSHLVSAWSEHKGGQMRITLKGIRRRHCQCSDM